MSRDKQIEEMARDICKSRFADGARLCKECENECLYYQIASALNAKGYRRQSEIIRCRDCDVPHNKWTGCPKLNGLVAPPDFYCAFAEPKIKGEAK